MKRIHAFSAVVLTLAAVATALPETASADGPFRFFAITPCRVYDSRPGPIAKGLHTLRVQGVCGVPVGAKAVALNVTIVGPSGPGYLSMWPVGVSEPLVATLNFVAGEPALANGAIAPLGPDSGGADDLSYRIAIPSQPSGTSNIVFDVTGYFATVP